MKCLVSLRNHYRRWIRRSLLEPDRTSEKLNESRVFVELTTYIENAVYSGTLLFKLSEIHVLYVNCLEDLGIKKAINKTRLMVRLLEHFPEVLEKFDGRNTFIVFKKGIENMLKKALKKRDSRKML